MMPRPTDAVMRSTQMAFASFGIARDWEWPLPAWRPRSGQLAIASLFTTRINGSLQVASIAAQELALRRNCIVTPALQGFDSAERLLYGASFRLCPKNGFFSATWILRRPLRRAQPFTARCAPSYVIPRSIFDRVCWIEGMGGWGGSEAAVSVKAFFSGVTILGLRGPVAWHRFKPSFHYDVTWDEVWRNQRLIARVCFEDRTWYEHWLPQVFQEHLTEQAERDLESDEIVAQHEEFRRQKVRSDADFWRVLLRQEPPAAVRQRRPEGLGLTGISWIKSPFAPRKWRCFRGAKGDYGRPVNGYQGEENGGVLTRLLRQQARGNQALGKHHSHHSPGVHSGSLFRC